MFYQKYRPKSFREIIGQDIVIKILKSFLKNPPHGYLFAGERGTGKTTTARIYAKVLNCLNPQDSEPCGSCRICKLFDENKFLDLIEIDAASHRRIEDIRNLQDHIGFRPLQGKYKVFIIDEAHSLTEEASNALLKTLEEPPSHVIFVLATTEPDKILPTIHSRVQRLDFRRISLPHIVSKLRLIAEREGLDYEEPALYLIAEEAFGSLRDAETLLEKIFFSLNPHSKITEEYVSNFLGHLSVTRILDFLDLLSKKDLHQALDFVFKIYANGYDLILFLKSFLKTLRQLIILKINPDFAKHLKSEKPEEIVEKMKKLSNNFSFEDLKKMNNLFFEALMTLRKEPPSPIFPIEIAILEFLS